MRTVSERRYSGEGSAGPGPELKASKQKQYTVTYRAAPGAGGPIASPFLLTRRHTFFLTRHLGVPPSMRRESSTGGSKSDYPRREPATTNALISAIAAIPAVKPGVLSSESTTVVVVSLIPVPTITFPSIPIPACGSHM